MMSSQILWQHSIIAMQRKSNDCNANQHDLQLKCQSIAMRISTIYNSNVNRLQCESARFAIQMSIDCNANQHDLQFKCQSIATRISTICNSNVSRLQCESARFTTQMSIDCNANQHDLQLKCQSIATRISTIDCNSNGIKHIKIIWYGTPVLGSRSK